MADRIVVREPVVADAEAMARVHLRAWQAGYAGLIPEQRLARMHDTLPERARYWARTLTDSTEGLLVALVEDTPERPGELVGICSYGEARDDDAPEGFGELYMINLDPPAWGTGVADALFSPAVAGLAERFGGGYLWVLAANRRARRFYLRHGWEPDGATRTAQDGAAAGLELARFTIRFADRRPG